MSIHHVLQHPNLLQWWLNFWPALVICVHNNQMMWVLVGPPHNTCSNNLDALVSTTYVDIKTTHSIFFSSKPKYLKWYKNFKSFKQGYNDDHYRGLLTAWIPFTLSYHLSLLVIMLDKSSRGSIHCPHNWWFLVLVCWPMLVCTWVWVPWKTSLMNLSFFSSAQHILFVLLDCLGDGR